MELAFALRGPEDGLRAARDYVALQPGEAEGAGIRAVVAVGASGERQARVGQALDSLSLDAPAMLASLAAKGDTASLSAVLRRSESQVNRSANAVELAISAIESLWCERTTRWLSETRPCTSALHGGP